MNTPSLATETALAARQLTLLGDRYGVGDDRRAALWRQLEEELETCRSDGSKRLAVLAFRADIEKNLLTTKSKSNQAPDPSPPPYGWMAAKGPAKGTESRKKRGSSKHSSLDKRSSK